LSELRLRKLCIAKLLSERQRPLSSLKGRKSSSSVESVVLSPLENKKDGVDSPLVRNEVVLLLRLPIPEGISMSWGDIGIMLKQLLLLFFRLLIALL
jgi:hypothetical protein